MKKYLPSIITIVIFLVFCIGAGCLLCSRAKTIRKVEKFNIWGIEFGAEIQQIKNILENRGFSLYHKDISSDNLFSYYVFNNSTFTEESLFGELQIKKIEIAATKNEKGENLIYFMRLIPQTWHFFSR